MLNRVNEVQQLGSFDLPYLGYVGGNCADEYFHAEIEVPFLG